MKSMLQFQKQWAEEQCQQLDERIMQRQSKRRPEIGIKVQ